MNQVYEALKNVPEVGLRKGYYYRRVPSNEGIISLRTPNGIFHGVEPEVQKTIKPCKLKYLVQDTGYEPVYFLHEVLGRGIVLKDSQDPLIPYESSSVSLRDLFDTPREALNSIKLRIENKFDRAKATYSKELDAYIVLEKKVEYLYMTDKELSAPVTKKAK